MLAQRSLRFMCAATTLIATACGSEAGDEIKLGGGPGIGEGKCAVFPEDNWWNQDISLAKADKLSKDHIDSITEGSIRGNLHPDFGTMYGIPYQYVSDPITKSTVLFDDVPEQSDREPYPIPDDPLIEDGSDAHMLMVHTDECVLYELFSASQDSEGWHAYSGAIWDLKENSTRPACWTSADAAGLPIYPGLARYEEVAKGEINHALRFTAEVTQGAYVAPASHYASTASDPSNPKLPPMGLRVRLIEGYDISGAPPQSKVILTALKKYGMILADNGSGWFISGARDPGWDDEDLDYMKTVPGSAFEAIETGPLTNDCD
jgi:hypothetical protein